jgi:hypothetical protein
VDATSANTASKVVARDASGNFSAGTITATLSGAATSATTATNLAGGAANQIAFQTGAGATGFVPAPTVSGEALTWNGSSIAWAAGAAAGITYLAVSTNYTAANNEGVLTDTSGGAFTVTLPATPATGAQVVVADAGSSWGTNNLTVGRNGSTIGGLAENLVCDITGASVQFVYDGTTWEVYAQIGGQGGNAVTLDGTQTLTNKTLTNPVINGMTGNTAVINFGSGQFYKDASGNVGIGTSSPAQKLGITGNAAVSGQIMAGTTTTYSDGTIGTPRLQWNARVGTYVGAISIADTSSQLAHWVLRNTNGNIADIGTSGTSLFISTANTERARIDSSGNLLVGLTSVGAPIRLCVRGSGTGSGTYSAYFENSAATLNFFVRDDGAINTGVAALSPYNLTTANAANLNVDSSGALARSVSSIKYKTDVQDATHGLAEVMSLRPVTYKGKNDGDKMFGGLIAEEVHAAGLTEFVQYASDESPDALHYGNMVSLAFKAIQEQQAMIEQLKADVAALKGA